MFFLGLSDMCSHGSFHEHGVAAETSSLAHHECGGSQIVKSDCAMELWGKLELLPITRMQTFSKQEVMLIPIFQTLTRTPGHCRTHQ